MRHLHSSYLPILLVFATSSSVHASPRPWTRWRSACEEILKGMRGEKPEVSADELRRNYNRHSLLRSEATILSRERALIKLTPGHDREDWEDAITLALVERMLDRTLPFWREDEDWFFQSTSPIRLYTRNSINPKLFLNDGFILMNGDLAVGWLRLTGQPAVELFE